MRQDGKFVGVDGSIPEGQGIVMAHLNECHELLEMASLRPPWYSTTADVRCSWGRPWTMAMKRKTMKMRRMEWRHLIKSNAMHGPGEFACIRGSCDLLETFLETGAFSPSWGQVNFDFLSFQSAHQYRCKQSDSRFALVTITAISDCLYHWLNCRDVVYSQSSWHWKLRLTDIRIG